MTGLLATKPRPVDVPALAEAALWQELELTPKPGLVDRLNNGSTSGYGPCLVCPQHYGDYAVVCPVCGTG